MITVACDGSVHATVTALLHGGGEPVAQDVALHYRPANPLEVTVAFDNTDVIDVLTGEYHCDSATAWLLPRDLLTAGHPAGATVHEMRISRSHDEVRVQLYPGSDLELTVALPGAPVDAFLAETFRSVPAGAEQLDLDAVIAQVLRVG